MNIKKELKKIIDTTRSLKVESDQCSNEDKYRDTLISYTRQIKRLNNIIEHTNDSITNIIVKLK